MKGKFKWIILSTIIVVVLSICGYFVLYNRSTPININLQFSKNLNTGKNLISVAEPYVKSYWKGKAYHVGLILMDVNELLQGETRITYVSEPKSGNPEIIEAIFDTVKNELVQINRWGKEDKLNPGRIAIDKWKIDSIDAYNIAKDSFQLEKEKFEYDKVVISTQNRDSESWSVQIFSPNKVYRCIIDPYDGKILDKRFRNLN